MGAVTDTVVDPAHSKKLNRRNVGTASLAALSQSWPRPHDEFYPCRNFRRRDDVDPMDNGLHSMHALALAPAYRGLSASDLIAVMVRL